MADTSVADWDDFWRFQYEALQETYLKKYPLTAQLNADTSGKNMSGSEVRVPILLNELQGAGALAEGATVNLPQVERTEQAHIGIAEMVMPISATKKLKMMSVENSSAKLADKVRWARESLQRLLNIMLNGDGTGLIAAITGGSSGSLTVDVDAATTPWTQLKPGTIVDVLTRSTGADAGQGLTRRIASVDKAAGTVTFSTSSFGGGSGNITFSTSSGIYLNGTYGNAVQGIEQIAGSGDVFEGIDGAAVPEWNGTDGRDGDTDPLPLSQTMLDAAFIELGMASSGIQPSPGEFFFVGDPKVISKYRQQFYALQRFPNPEGTLRTGFTGATYNGFTLVPDFDHKAGSIHGVYEPDLQMYSFPGLPNFDEETGSRWQRFSRTLSTESWLYDARQLGAKRRDTMLRLEDLTQAA